MGVCVCVCIGLCVLVCLYVCVRVCDINNNATDVDRGEGYAADSL